LKLNPFCTTLWEDGRGTGCSPELASLAWVLRFPPGICAAPFPTCSLQAGHCRQAAVTPVIESLMSNAMRPCAADYNGVWPLGSAKREAHIYSMLNIPLNRHTRRWGVTPVWKNIAQLA
jgi:hypothetical protein